MTRCAFRHASALILTVLYAVMLMTPLVPFVMHSPALAHALAGECSGDCRICGCEPKRSDSHTCCCCQKRQQEKKHGRDCCTKPDKTGAPGWSCASPCGKHKQLILPGAEKSEQLPSGFAQCAEFDFLEELTSPNDCHPTFRHLDPPDPPPKLSFIS